MMLEVTDASTTIPNDWASHRRRINSIAKNTPASGALSDHRKDPRGTTWPTRSSHGCLLRRSR